MDSEIPNEKWLTSPEILFYIIDSYAGIEEPRDGRRGVGRRVFLWEEEGVIKMGNTEAFVEHLGRKYSRSLKTHYASVLHQTLRELGEPVATHAKHAPRRSDSPRCGRFTQPKPDAWVVGQQILH